MSRYYRIGDTVSGERMLLQVNVDIANAAFDAGMEKAAEIAEKYHEMHHDVNDNDHEVAVAVAGDIRSIAGRFKE